MVPEFQLMVKQMERQPEKRATKKRIVVAVHGIGDQVRNTTSQSVARIIGLGSIPLGRFPEEIEKKVDGHDLTIVRVVEPQGRRVGHGDADVHRPLPAGGMDPPSVQLEQRGPGV